METLDTIEHWRAKIFSSLLKFVLVSGAITAVPSVAAAVKFGMWSVVAVDTCALTWLTAIWWFKRVPYTARVINFIALVFMVGVGMMISVGPISLIYLFAASVLATILLGMRPALVTLACAGVAVFGLCYAGVAQLHFNELFDGTLLAAFVVALNFVFVGAVITVSCAMLLRGLASSLDDLAVVAGSLEQGKNELHRLAYYDVLTGLPNRRLLVERIDTLLAAAEKGAHTGALLFIDLDRFKTINDARGHAIGDAVLRHAADCLSTAAGIEHTVARIGGDEFVVLVPRLDDAGHGTVAGAALEVADKLRHAINQRFEIEGQMYTSSASIGVTLLPRSGKTAHDLLREADTAMYRAKLAGRNRTAIFESAMFAEVEQRLTLERDLAAALLHGELAMHLQLQVDGAGKPSGAELLARWRRADGSFVPPDRFIPVAEESGLIIPLGQWALREACDKVLRLAEAGHRFPLSVNVSPSQFRQPDFVAQVRTLLDETGAPAHQLIFELTEGLLIDDLGGTLARMHELAALGIRLSIDDFGTGYSSLAYLTRMPLFELKIDRSFIRGTPADAAGTAIVQSILAMAAHLGLRAIAEGVETQEQAAFLAANGVLGMQGFLFARPMPFEDAIELLAARPSGFSIGAAGKEVFAAAAA